MNPEEFSHPEVMRYSRQFPIIGLEGQKKLKHAKVIGIGCGGLGSPALQFLAAAGVGTLALVDDDVVEVSNLHRQILFTEADIGQSKALVAAQRLRAQNPHVNYLTYQVRLDETNANDLIAPYDIVVDGSDNYSTRYFLNDVCFKQQKPLVSASIYQFQGQCSVFNYQMDAPCYRCLYATPPPLELAPSCALAGVLGALPGVLGTLQAIEVVKLIVGQGEVLSGRLLTFDALKMCFKEYKIHKNPQCPLCQHNKSTSNLFPQETNSADATIIEEISPQQLSCWLHDSAYQVNLIDVREPYEREICNIGGELLSKSEFKIEKVQYDKQALIVVYCKQGGRSRQIAKLLKTYGYQQVYSLRGGIIAWADEIDSSLVIY